MTRRRRFSAQRAARPLQALLVILIIVVPRAFEVYLALWKEPLRPLIIMLVEGLVRGARKHLGLPFPAPLGRRCTTFVLLFSYSTA